MIALSMMPNPAMAEYDGRLDFRGRTFSYTEFRELIDDGLVARISVHDNGNADFLLNNGSTGKVQLAGDLSSFLNVMQSKGIDLVRAVDEVNNFSKYQPILI